MSKSLTELINSVQSAQTSQSINIIIENEIVYLKKALFDPNLKEKLLQDYLLRVAYCYLFGREAEFAFMKCIELSTKADATSKKIGYLVSSLIIPPDHDFSVMIVNQMIIDTKSMNILDISYALIALTKLARDDLIPMLLDNCVKLTKNSHHMVRKFALSALLRFHQLNNSCLADYYKDIIQKLDDQSLNVISVCLDILYELCRNNSTEFKHITERLCKLYMEVIDRKFGENYQYHNTPAPWVQIKILNILSLLGTADDKTSMEIYPILLMAISHNTEVQLINEALVFEIIRTICSIYPNDTLIDKALSFISYFLKSTDNNLVYVGIQCLIQIVNVDPKRTVNYQMNVIECLESKDDSIKSKSIYLLSKMCNPLNIQIISEKLINYIKSTNDDFNKQNTITILYKLCEAYAPNPLWFIRTITLIFEISNINLNSEIFSSIVNILKDGTGDINVDNELISNTVELYIQLLNIPLCEGVVSLQCWILGEYLSDGHSVTIHEVMVQLCKLIKRCYSDECVAIILNSLIKLVCRTNTVPNEVKDVIRMYFKSQNVVLQQLANEFILVSKNVQFFKSICKSGGNNKISKISLRIPTIKSYIENARREGKKEYELPESYQDITILPEATLKIEAYDLPSEFQPRAPEEKIEENDDPLSLKVVQGSFGFSKQLPPQKKDPKFETKPQTQIKQNQKTANKSSSNIDLIDLQSDTNDDLLGFDVLPDEKEVLANSLFQGIGGNTQPNENIKKPNRPTGPFKSTNPQTKPLTNPQSTPATGKNQPNVSNKSQPINNKQPQQSIDDLFNVDLGNSNQKQKNINMNEIDDIFSNISMNKSQSNMNFYPPTNLNPSLGVPYNPNVPRGFINPQTRPPPQPKQPNKNQNDPFAGLGF